MTASLRIRAAFASLTILAAACGGDPVGPLAAPGASSLVLTPVSGADQVGLAARPLAGPLQVRVEHGGAPAAGVQVVWHTTNGSLEPSGVTDARGTATAVWTLPPREGSVRATARLAGQEAIVFRAEAQFPEVQVAGGNGQEGTVGEVLAQPLQVQVTWQGEPLPGEAVRWSFLTAPVLTGADGIASAIWTLPTTAGTSRATATIGNQQEPMAYFTATGAPGPVARLESAESQSMEPQFDNGNGTWSHISGFRFHVYARDAYGNLIKGLPVAWSIVTGEGTSEGTGTDDGGLAYVSVTPAAGYAGDIRVRAVAGGAEVLSDAYHYAHFILRGEPGEPVTSAVTVTPGTTVRWVLYGSDPHLLGPPGGATARLEYWGAVVAQPFTVIGVHEWVCANHGQEKFTIVVAP
jgi:hypothetical protein